ncbi:MAG: triose-phosphate isomerase [Phycisphaerales bacterium]|nr:MAG: triose-phosphate isomerase [Phycisphaerales bacterium]
MRTPLIAGNWKMHKTLAEARALVGGIRAGVEGVSAVDVLVCPPFQLLLPMAKEVAGTRIMLGAQNVHEEPKGAFTGEVSVPMLADVGCTHVIVGHSERRHVFGEDGQRLARKVRAVVDAGLTAVYCVGETLDEREAGRTHQVVEDQLSDAISAEIPANKLVVAYEPVWAIGTGKTATPGQAQDVHAFIRPKLADVYGRDTTDALRILYGGSVKPGNAADLAAQPDVDGALVGGACLVAGDFLAIISAAASVGAAT